ncbi:hypothetical protein DdX_05081 [Ditylenchus destructor]|uniref:Uncharacterized protein n=1 Tax=Ditylenchus destructor TaxID=166010 RepID=A0AAD4R7C3_9BILA|nr:hypothetical protein DdX_05081 [Ditylenchus destructor]
MDVDRVSEVQTGWTLYHMGSGMYAGLRQAKDLREPWWQIFKSRASRRRKRPRLQNTENAVALVLILKRK